MMVMIVTASWLCLSDESYIPLLRNEYMILCYQYILIIVHNNDFVHARLDSYNLQFDNAHLCINDRAHPLAFHLSL